MIKKKEQKNLSTNEYVNLADVQGSFLYAKDGTIFQYIKVQPISTALMNENEKAQLTRKMTQELSPLGIPFKLLFFSRPTDVRQTIEYYDGVKMMTTASNKRDALTKTVKFLSQMSTGGVLERQTFFVIWTNKLIPTAQELEAKTIEFRNALQASKINANICDEVQINNMLGLFYDPLFIADTVISTTNSYTFLQEGLNEKAK